MMSLKTETILWCSLLLLVKLPPQLASDTDSDSVLKTYLANEHNEACDLLVIGPDQLGKSEQETLQLYAGKVAKVLTKSIANLSPKVSDKKKKKSFVKRSPKVSHRT